MKCDKWMMGWYVHRLSMNFPMPKFVLVQSFPIWDVTFCLTTSELLVHEMALLDTNTRDSLSITAGIYSVSILIHHWFNSEQLNQHAIKVNTMALMLLGYYSFLLGSLFELNTYYFFYHKYFIKLYWDHTFEVYPNSGYLSTLVVYLWRKQCF